MQDDKDLKILWQEAGNQTRIRLNETQLLTDMEKTMIDFDRGIRNRDLAETGAAILVIIFFGFQFSQREHLWGKIGAGIVVGASLLIIIILLMARISGHATRREFQDSDMHQQLLLFKQKVERQIQLLDTILYWYLSPLYIGIALSTFGSVNNIWLAIALGVIVILPMTFFYYWVYKVNKKAIREDLLPLKTRIEQALLQMEEQTI